MLETRLDAYRRQWANRDGVIPNVKVMVDPQTFLRQRTGGISRLFTELVWEFDETPLLGVNVVLPIRRSNNRHAAEQLAYRGVTASPSWLPRGVLYAPWWVTGNRFRERVDIVHHTYYDGRFFKAPTGTRRVITIYDMIPEHFAGTDLSTSSHLKKREYVKAADLVICISEATRQDLLEAYGELEAQVVVIPLSVQKGFGRKHDPLPNLPSVYALYVGARAGYKDFSLLPKAMSRLKHSGMSLPLVVVGSPFTRAERALVHDLGLDASTFQVRLGDEELRRAYANATLLVQTSRYESSD